MFSQVLSLSQLTFMALSHKKIYFVGLSIGALLTLLSLLLGPLGFEEEKRLSINFGLAGAQVGAIFLVVLSGATLLKEEIENQSALRENFEEGPYYYLVLDLVSGGEMFDHLSQQGPYSEADAARLVREVASALAFRHGVGLVHGDLVRAIRAGRNK